MKIDIDKLVRDNIKSMIPYSSARKEFSGTASILLDANENSYGSPLPENFNRYPDPLQAQLKEKIGAIKGVEIFKIFLGNGSDEAMDLLMRIFCEPGLENILICPPTYGMYEVCAAVNDVRIRRVNLTRDFQLDMKKIKEAINQLTRIIFICSPNNPTGNCINPDDIEYLLQNFPGIIVIDEAYIDYSSKPSFSGQLENHNNLVTLQTFSKGWGLAGLRLGMAFADESIINYLNNIKYPYNINSATQQMALDALENSSKVNSIIKTTIEQREWLKKELEKLQIVQRVYPSDANFLLVKMYGARNAYGYLSTKGIIVRDRSKVALCEDCLRITIGTPKENKQLIQNLKKVRYEKNIIR